MKTNREYRYVKVKEIPYGSEIRSLEVEEMVVSKCIKKIIPKLYTIVTETKKLAFSYNKELCRLAPLIYGVAKCSKQITEGKNSLKGVLIDAKKDIYSIDKLKNLHDQLKKAHEHFKKRMRQNIYGVVAIVGVVVLWVAAAITPAVMSRPFALIFLWVSIAIVVIVAPIIVIMEFMVKLDIEWKNHTKDILDREYPKYFEMIYKRLHFERKQGRQFLYSIDKKPFADENRVYQLASRVHKANAFRTCLHKEQPSLYLLADTTV